jgi:hypothetical protein
VPRYLDDEWVAAWADAVRAARDDLARAASGPLRVTTRITADGAPDVAYHLAVGPDGVDAGAGPAEPSDLTFRQPRRVAEAVARGRLSAQEAFLHGDLAVGGDVRLLVANVELFRALEGALAGLRAATTWDGADA